MFVYDMFVLQRRVESQNCVPSGRFSADFGLGADGGKRKRNFRLSCWCICKRQKIAALTCEARLRGRCELESRVALRGSETPSHSPRKFYNEESGQVKNLPPLRFLEESIKWFARRAQLSRATALIA